MFLTDDQIEQEYIDKPTAFWCGLIQGAGIGVIGTLLLGGGTVFLMSIF